MADQQRQSAEHDTAMNDGATNNSAQHDTAMNNSDQQINPVDQSSQHIATASTPNRQATNDVDRRTASPDATNKHVIDPNDPASTVASNQQSAAVNNPNPQAATTDTLRGRTNPAASRIGKSQRFPSAPPNRNR
ncbi:uncharacterized protein LTR77_002086 [Saxophila tyrrhenica]|uniref:Uncharacterized protein n=1 Tax=Saxophila tyrrhenica TaxID=1690608 RepID=A0AAV9PI70_9PEZI|nr:hypothetical protein LTR77_002086 [Saxophila tyrrhenica]